MKTIWARIGMSVEITDEEFEKLKNTAHDPNSKAYGYDLYGDLDVTEWLLEKFQKSGKINGDSYIPQDEFDNEL